MVSWDVAEREPDKVGLNRYFPSTPIDQHRQADGAGSPEVGQKIERATCRAAREHNIIHQKQWQMVDRDVEMSGPDHWPGADLGEVIAVQSDIEHAATEMNISGAFKQAGEPLGQDFSTCANADDVERIARMEFRSDTVRQLLHQASNVGLVVIIPHRREGYWQGAKDAISEVNRSREDGIKSRPIGQRGISCRVGRGWFSDGDVDIIDERLWIGKRLAILSHAIEMEMKQTKPFWEMTTAELRKATREFDDPAYQPPALPQTHDDVAQQRRAKNKGGRPRKGLGARTISLTVERALLARSDAYAKRLGISRAVLVQRGLNAIVPTQPRRERKRPG